MNEFEDTGNRLLEQIRPLLESDNSPDHLSLDEWTQLLHNSGDDATLERLGDHLTHCRACSQVLMEAEEYAEKVRDVEVLARMTPRYIPDATPSRVILETAGSRVWVERVRGGWLLASMDLDIEVLSPSLPEAVLELETRVEARSLELMAKPGPVSRQERRMLNWLRGHDGERWTERFRAELPDVLDGATPRIQALEAGSNISVEESPDSAQVDRQLLSEAEIGQMSETFLMALQLAQTMLNAADRPSDFEVIRRKVRNVLNMLQTDSGSLDVDEELLVQELQARYTTFIGAFGILEDHDEKHRPWILDRKAQIQWRFWRRYERFLREKRGRIPGSLRRLDELSDTILDRLEDPNRPGAWDRRGVVVGSVQSGKTENYTSVICKAADAGYKLIIVMAGLNNNLRSQTQWRIDEGFLGWDTQAGRRIDNQPNQKIGVGRLRGEPWMHANPLTSNAINGDFNRVHAMQSPIVPGGSDPVVLVVKKYKSVLQNVRRWAVQVVGEGPEGQEMVRGVPLLLIDDEADSASINTAPRPRDRNGKILDDYDVTTINGEIRKLLNTFEQKAYVGYTATPFANIFIAPDAETTRHGRDIFPESFIINLPTPSNYVGPARVFGLAPEASSDIEEIDALPIIRTVDDYEDAFPPKHKKGHVPGGIPDSLKTAIRAFILACAARRARGQKTDHNSMLVHVSRIIDVQSDTEELIKDELANLQRQIEFAGDTLGRQLMKELEQLWKMDFEPTSARILGMSPVTWQQVRHQLHEAASKIQTRMVNSDSLAALDYVEHPNGLSVIVIGGDKLSRGLTLEGLSISYYLRATNMYDTLMQMGRWFGYRPGYLDLCRLYTTEELVLWYRHIALADSELRREFDQMEAIGATPKDYALRVRTHPEGMLVTAINKMRDSVVMRLSFSGRLAEVSFIHKETDRVTQNLQATEALVDGLGVPIIKRGNWVWSGVSGETIVDYLTRLRSHPHATSADTARMAEYITSQMSRVDPELTNWTVALISNTRPDASKPSAEVYIGQYPVVTTVRDPVENVRHVYAIRKGRIVDPPDEYLDFDGPMLAAALQETIDRYHRNPGRRTKEPTRPSGEVVREMRPVDKGLLILYPLYPPTALYGNGIKAIIGYAVSFPSSTTAEGIEYRIGELFWRRQIGDDDDDA